MKGSVQCPVSSSWFTSAGGLSVHEKDLMVAGKLELEGHETLVCMCVCVCVCACMRHELMWGYLPD